MNHQLRGGSAHAGPSRICFVTALIARAAPLLGVLAVLACAGKPAPDANLAKVWRDYRRLPDPRVLAVAGNLRQDRFVTGASGGNANVPEAEAAALRECERRRLRMRQEAACKIYAIGDEVVWPGP